MKLLPVEYNPGRIPGLADHTVSLVLDRSETC